MVLPLINTYHSNCYIVRVDEHWFLRREGAKDWADAPQFAEKFGSYRQACGRAEDESALHPSKHIRVVRCKQVFQLEEI